MKLGNWIALLGCVGLGIGATVAAQGCTATACAGDNCDNLIPGAYSQDSGASPTGDSSTTPPVTGEDGSFVDTGSTAPDPCNSCLYGQCVGVYSNCVGNTSCLGIYQCATSPACAVDGGNCVQDCFNAGSTTAQALYLALGDCDQSAQCTNITATAACASTCNPSAAYCAMTSTDAGGGEDSSTPEDAGAADGGAVQASCSACLSSSCSSQLAACASGTPCASYNQCLGGCADATCDTACASAYPSGATAAQSLGSCTQANCSQCFN